MDSTHIGTNEQIQALPLTNDLTSPLLVQPGERIRWRGDERVVVLRGDIVEDGVRWVQVVAERPGRVANGVEDDIDLDLDLAELKQLDGTAKAIATEKHVCEVNVAEIESSDVTVHGVVYTFTRETVAQYRFVGVHDESDAEAMFGTLRCRYFTSGTNVVRCSNETGTSSWSSEYWGAEDSDEITTVQSWSGTARPFRGR